MKDAMTRKEFLQQLAFLTLAAFGGGVAIAGCGGKKEEPQTGRQPAGRPETAAADPCADVSGLTEAELKMRNETLQYVAVSPYPDKLCDNCKFWTPAPAGQPCGGCQLIKGPIHPKGYCTSWFTQQT